MNIIFLLIAVGGQLLVPGWLVARQFRNSATLVDAFVFGVLTAVFSSILFALFFDTIESIAVAYRATLVALIFFLLVNLKRRGVSWASERWVTSIGLSKFPIFLTIMTVLSTFIFVATHNLGFDDIAHLYYLEQISKENIFPVFIEVRESWSLARYPMFGLFTKVITLGLAGGDFFGYYFIGALVLVFLLAKVYEIVLEWTKKKKTAVIAYLGALTILMIGGLDNYLNYGFYPFQQAKLIFLMGMLYLIEFVRDREVKTLMFLGGTLLISSLIFHFNMLLLAPVVVALGAIFLFLQRKSARGLLTLALMMLLPILVVLITLRPDSSPVRYIEVIEEAKTGVPTVKPPEPNFLEAIWKKVTGLSKWVTDGRYKDFYITRAYSAELLLLPLFILTICVVGSISFLYSLAIGIFAATLGFQFVLKIPVQAASSILQSGPWLIALDFWRSDIELDHEKQAFVFSDPYTAFVLNAMGHPNVLALHTRDATQIFSPLISTPAELILKKFDVSEVANDSSFLFNVRYWGFGSREKFGLGKRIELPEIDYTLDRFFNESQKRSLKPTILSLASLASRVIDQPLELISRVQASHAWSGPVDFSLKEDQQISYYRDSAVVSLRNLAPGQGQLLEIVGVGDFLEVMIKKTGRKQFEILPKIEKKDNSELSENGDEEIHIKIDHASKKIFLLPKKKFSEIKILLTLEVGQFSGLGEINGVKVSKHLLDVEPTPN